MCVRKTTRQACQEEVRMSEVILFDLDGTLTDSAPGITRCVQYALRYFGIDEPDTEKLKCFVGPPLKEMFMEYADLDEAQAEEAVVRYRERYTEKGIFENEVYDGIPELLQLCREKGRALGVASSKPQVFVEQILEYFDLRKYFDVVVGAELDGRRTNKAEVIEEALRQLGCEKNRHDVLMVGDRRHDVEGAAACGLQCIGAAYGYGGREELKQAGAVYIADTVDDLRILAKNFPRPSWRNFRLRRELLGQRTEKKTVKPEDDLMSQIPLKSKIWRILKPMLTYDIILFLVTYMGALLLMTFTGMGGLEDRLYRTSALMTGIACLIAIPLLWKQMQKDEGMFTMQRHQWNVPTAMACVLLVMSFGHLLNTFLNVTGFTTFFNGYTQLASDIYEGQNWLLLIVTIGVLSSVAEELAFRGMIYQRAKDFWGAGWATVISGGLFGLYHGNVVQLVYGMILSVLLIIVYERTGTLWAPIAAHIGENIWGLFRGQLMEWLRGHLPGAGTTLLLAEALICAAAFWYLFLYGRVENRRRERKKDGN